MNAMAHPAPQPKPTTGLQLGDCGNCGHRDFMDPRLPCPRCGHGPADPVTWTFDRD